MKSVHKEKLTVDKTLHEYIPGDMHGLIDRIAAYDNTANALGYSVYYYAKNIYSLPELKFIAVDGVEPSESNITSHIYPFVNEFYGVLPKRPSKNARLLLEWLLSDDGQTFVASCGYVPIDPTKVLAPQTLPAVFDIDLWDKDYYAVLPGEGETMLVYDSKGQAMGSFTLRGLRTHDDSYSQFAISPGLYTARELADKALFANGRQHPLAPETIRFPTKRDQNGFMRFNWGRGVLYVYDNGFKLRYTVQSEVDTSAYNDAYHFDKSATILHLGENELLLFPHGDTYICSPQIRTKNGNLVTYLTLNNPNAHIVGVFAESHLITKEGNPDKYAICSLDGSVIMENVTPILQERRWFSNFGNIPQYAFSSRYYIRNGWLYDADFQALYPIQLMPEGHLYGRYYLSHYREVGLFIEGMVYDLNGAISTGRVHESQWGEFIQGYGNGQLCVKRGDNLHRFAVKSGDVELQDFNDAFAYFYNNVTQEHEVRFLKTGETFRLKGAYPYNRISLSDHYFIVMEAVTYSTPFLIRHYIIDGTGELRFDSNASTVWYYFRPTSGDMVVMEHGPYIGIVDLDGNWLVKTLCAYLANDDYWSEY